MKAQKLNRNLMDADRWLGHAIATGDSRIVEHAYSKYLYDKTTGEILGGCVTTDLRGMRRWQAVREETRGYIHK